MSPVPLSQFELSALTADGGREKPYWIYQAALFGRSILIIVAVLIADVLVKKVPVFSVLPFRCTGMNSHGMKILNVMIPHTSVQSIRKVRSSYSWVMRTAVVLIVCFAFENLIVLNLRYDMRRPEHWNSIVVNCLTGWDCYAFRAPNSTLDAAARFNDLPNFLPIYLVWDLQHVCNAITSAEVTLDETITQRNSRSSSVVCYRAGDMQFHALVATLALMGAAAALVFIFFELLVSVMLRYRRSVWNTGLLIDALIVISLCAWILILVMEGMQAIATWVSRLTFLAIPVLLVCARTVGNVLRQEIERKQEERGRELLQGKLGEELDKLGGSNEDLLNSDYGGSEGENGPPGKIWRRRGFRHKPRRFKAKGLWGRLRHSNQRFKQVTEEGTSERSTAM
eukprot:Gregarina_sp_Poly_1__3132@NODE_1886_length_3135_cov_267_379400_g1223_i0_p2_GENE_NODE_1886_length_3135_cov_267_379400_g1223_i0NODE_1886_length_3135_cov_267_379400_g1223_i0_p2_ORF_typecomplete_len396_score23_80Phlebovirus_G1/PF07243_11/0_36YfhO/PF09586_10/1_1e03YfhO/PF09586_10/0_0095DUF998/PF06197_13/6_6e02DUF998/PF06197_13/2e02DUF998/PF06197_13/10_NODE_1886_length_3135_cov_267_379400_g1223_i015862773